MGKQKLFRYQAIEEMPLILHRKNYRIGDYSDLRQNWRPKVFENDFPIVLELAAGKGEYALELARVNQNQNFVAIDIKGDRIYKGAREAIDDGLTNIRFFRASIDHIENYFGPEEVDEIWVTFPDPYLSDTKEKKRLTHFVFIERYKKILKKDGFIHLKTDSVPLMEFTREVIRQQDLKELVYFPDVDLVQNLPEELLIQTHYERIHRKNGLTIQYLKFSPF